MENMDFSLLGVQATIAVVLIVEGLKRLGLSKRFWPLAALLVAWGLGGLALLLVLVPQAEIYVRYFLLSTLVGLGAPLARDTIQNRLTKQ